jgi:hypothetical protein
MPIYHRLGQVPRKRHVVFREPRGRAVRRGADRQQGVRRSLLAALSRPPAHAREGHAAAPRPELGARARAAVPAPALPHPPARVGRQHHAQPRAVALQRRRRAALRAARPRGRLLLPQRPGRRGRVHQRRTRCARDADGRPAVLAGRLPGGAAGHHAPLPLLLGAGAVPRHREHRLRAHAEAVSERARAAHRERAVLGARHPPPRAPADGRFRRATSACS